jgi:5-methyltetrahydropteroyltriglutamate--homocysteine methyltransferase
MNAQPQSKPQIQAPQQTAIQIHALGLNRMGENRELKFALEQYWQNNLSSQDLFDVAKNIKQNNWKLQQQANMDLITVGDFAFYDHVLNTACYINAVPSTLKNDNQNDLCKEYFGFARGNTEKPALEMTKWFNTNYHYIVPELNANTQFKLNLNYVQQFLLNDIDDAKAQGHGNIKAVLLGPVSFLYLSKAQSGVHKLDLLPKLIDTYAALLNQLKAKNIAWVQIDEPILSLDLSPEWHRAFEKTYSQLNFEGLNILLANYFGELQNNLQLACSLPVQGLHIDGVYAAEEISKVVDWLPQHKVLSLGVIDGRNIWKNNLQKTINTINNIQQRRQNNIWLATSCSLLHAPANLELEKKMSSEIKNWLAFAKQKLQELNVLKTYFAQSNAIDKDIQTNAHIELVLQQNKAAIENRQKHILVNNPSIRKHIQNILTIHNVDKRTSEFEKRKNIQHTQFQLPLLPTTTIGSFPQTTEVRSLRAQFKKGEITEVTYTQALQKITQQAIRIQEDIGLDVLVHGEFERNDMVEYFAEYLDGFTFTEHAWVQSYGSRCVKPPIIYGDVARKQAITVEWSTFAQAQTEKHMKGMLTGPVTMLHWSFVRDDQPKKDTCLQIAVALRAEVTDLANAGIHMIQIDEPAYREGLPLRKQDWGTYLNWASQAFRVSTSDVGDKIQIHTHMCYSEFSDILPAIAAMDADVISIETTRSNMDLLDSFVEFNYPNDIGPGVWDIHSPRVPSQDEMFNLIQKAMQVLPLQNLWLNPDCGLKTRNWEQSKQALTHLVGAAKQVRQGITAQQKQIKADAEFA